MIKPRFDFFTGRRECWLDREKNRDFFSLKTNQINVSCECPETGYEWSSRFGLCVDVNECTRGIHNCTYEDGESCINLPGHFDCICRYGYVYSLNKGHCVLSMTIKNALRVETIEPTVTKRSLLDRIVDVIGPPSFSNPTLIIPKLRFNTVLSLSLTFTTFPTFFYFLFDYPRL